MSLPVSDKIDKLEPPPDAISDGVVRVCLECQRINVGAGEWHAGGDYVIPTGVRVSHGLCLACCERLYGPYAPCAGEFPSHLSSDTD